MVWRIHFSEDDLARIQVSPTLGPLAETVLALALLRCSRQPRNMLSEWRGQVRVTPRMRPLTALIPPDCNGVDLPTLVGETATIEHTVFCVPALRPSRFLRVILDNLKIWGYRPGCSRLLPILATGPPSWRTS